MLEAAKEEIFSVPMVWTGEGVLPLAADPASLEDHSVNERTSAPTHFCTTTQLRKNSRLGSARKNPAPHQGSAWSNSASALGIDGALLETRGGSRYTGKERDSESGLDNFGARYNSSQYGRFMSPDPANIRADVEDFTDPQGWNGYAYVRNNPLSLTDPDGLSYTVCIKDENDEQKCTTYNRDEDFRNAVHDSPGASTRGNNDNGQILAGGKVVGTYDRIDVDLPAGVPDMLHQTGVMSDAGVKAAMIATAPEYLVAAGGAAAVELAGQSSLTVFEGAEVAVKDHALRHLASDALKSQAKAAIQQAISSGQIRYISGGTFIGRVLIQGQQYVFTGAFQNGVAQIGRITEGIRDSLGRFLQ
jgi:RHS repeat-associated protein